MTLAVLIARMTRLLTPWTYARMVGVASHKGVARAVADGRIVRLLADQYTVRLHATSFVSRALASLECAGGRAALAGTSALHWWGASDVPPEVYLAAPWSDRPRGPSWLRIRRFAVMPESIDYRGARLLLPELAVVTAHSQLAPSQRAEALYLPLRMGLVSPQSVGEAALTLARVPGRRDLVSRLARAERGAESYLEERADARVLRGPTLSRLVRQHWVDVESARYRLDSFDPASLTAVEFDGKGAHDAPEARQRDYVRDARLAAAGILTLRFAYEDVVGRPDWCRRIAEETIATRRHQ